jgi:hypothetical protein
LAGHWRKPAGRSCGASAGPFVHWYCRQQREVISVAAVAAAAAAAAEICRAYADEPEGAVVG